MTISLRLAVMTLAVVALATFNSCVTQKTTVAPTSYQPQPTQPKAIPMILDSDFGSSTDDLFALMMLNHYIDDGLVDLKGVVVDREGEDNAGVVDILNTYYGHPDIPIGQERNGVKNPRCFIPYNGIYVLTRQLGDHSTVMTIVNGADEPRTMPVARYAEVIGEADVATDVPTGRQVDLTHDITLPARGTLILDL